MKSVGAAPPDLLGHWKLTGDAQDYSSHGNHGNAQKLDMQDGENAAFDGRQSYIEVPHSESLRLGTQEFTIALRIHTEEELDDALGDLLSKYDPENRRGFHFSILNNAGVTSSQSNDRQLHFGLDEGSTPGSWTDHGRLGNAVLIYSLAVYQGQLFAGTCEPDAHQAGRVFRFDGETWTDCGSPDRCNAVSSLAVYQGKLYAAVSKYRLAGSSLSESENPHPGGKVYCYQGDGQWMHCGTLPETEAINGMAVYRGHLYAGSMYAPAGFYRYEGGTQWTSCGTPDGKRVEALTVYNGGLFASGYDQGAVYRFDGQQWEHQGVLPDATQTYGFATHHGQLYVSEWPNASVYRWKGGKQWQFAGRLGDEQETMPLMVYNGKMYGGTLPLAEVYRYDDPEWTQVGRLDFTEDVRYRRTWTMAIFQGRLFAGTLPSGHVHSVEIGRNVTYDHAIPSGWVHLAAVRDTHQLRLYVDGKLVAHSARSDHHEYDISNEQPLKIGAGAGDFFNGKMQDVRLYQRALTTREIQRLAKEGVQ